MREGQQHQLQFQRIAPGASSDSKRCQRYKFNCWNGRLLNWRNDQNCTSKCYLQAVILSPCYASESSYLPDHQRVWAPYYVWTTTNGGCVGKVPKQASDQFAEFVVNWSRSCKARQDEEKKNWEKRLQDAETAKEDAETAKKAAERASQDWEKKFKDAEQASQDWEKKFRDADAARDNAEQGRQDWERKFKDADAARDSAQQANRDWESKFNEAVAEKDKAVAKKVEVEKRIAGAILVALTHSI